MYLKMLKIGIDRVIEAREYIHKHTDKSDTFAGLITFLLSIKNRKPNDRYLEADMKRFSEIIDKACYFNEKPFNYPNKTWFAFLSEDWKNQILNEYLRGEKILVNDLVISLFWYRKDKLLGQLIEEFKMEIGEDIFEFLFTEKKEEDQYVIDSIDREELYQRYKGDHKNYTVKFGGDLIKSRASALSSATFGQTLYSSLEIRKVMQVADFDFEGVYGLKTNTQTQTQKNNIVFLNTIRLSKPFLLLAGISGTGKTRFIREQAKASGSLSETYCLTSVRPDWHEPSDLLGYISRLSGKMEYITTNVLNFIAKAWKALIDAGLELRVETVEGYGERLSVCGDKVQLDQIPPYWLCLDEMNLAPVEQYFADYLSVLETREWHWSGEVFKYLTDPLLKANIFTQIENNIEFRQQLGLEGSQYDVAWDAFSKFGLGIPFNLLVAGTVNMDETTHGFSRKVIDRALSFDFGEFFPNDYNAYFESITQNKTLSYPVLSSVNLSDLPEIDGGGKETIKFLNAVNGLLHNTPFKLAYRALNELLLAVVSQNPKNNAELLAVWDDFLMCKVMPRIEGDSDKLMNGRSEESLLKQLENLIQLEFIKLKEDSDSQEISRPDLYREHKGGDDIIIPVICRSLEKLKWMQTRLENSGFTSFWP